MKKQQFEQLQESIYYQKLDNGLDVYVLPKEGFNKTYSTFTTKYGSIDNHFAPLASEQLVKVPDGIAHFLEHKMFEKPDGTDVFQDFSRQGASTNAFTSYTRTAYLFSSTSHVDENLTTLIDFVQTAAFTEKSVEKEKGIIGQEIRMYNDNPDWRVYSGVIENMYDHHPIKIDIAGTIESISHITKELLLECYTTFYHPSNMLLFIVGPVEPEHIFELVEKTQKAKDYQDMPPIKREYPEEPKEVAQQKSILKMAVETPKVLIGFKDQHPGRKGEEMLKHEQSVKLLLELMFGQSAEFYETLFNEGLIDESFSYEYTEEQSFGFSIIGGNTEDPDKLSQRLREMIYEYKEKLVDSASFERVRKKKIGNFLRALNSPEFIANQFTRYRFNEMDLFNTVPILEALTVDDLNQTLKEHFVDSAFTECQVVKKK